MYKLGEYLACDTIIHNLDPRVKILSIIALSIYIIAAHLPGCLIITLFCLIIIALAHLTIRDVWDMLKPLLFFAALLFFLHALFTEGSPVIALPGLAVTNEGLILGTLTVWRFVNLILIAGTLTMTTSSSEMISALEYLLLPLNVFKGTLKTGAPAQYISTMIALALGILPSLIDEYENMRAAQIARGADYSVHGIMPKIRLYKHLLRRLLLNTLDRIDELADAMEARAYRIGDLRTAMKVMQTTALDFIALFTVIFFVTFSLLLDAFIFVP
jgi:energy-coupling factor transporter transmembrane protein EcfT